MRAFFFEVAFSMEGFYNNVVSFQIFGRKEQVQVMDSDNHRRTNHRCANLLRALRQIWIAHAGILFVNVAEQAFFV